MYSIECNVPNTERSAPPKLRRVGAPAEPQYRFASTLNYQAITFLLHGLALGCSAWLGLFRQGLNDGNASACVDLS